MEGIAIHSAEQRRETAVQGASVHVTASLSASEAGDDGVLVEVFGKGNEGLLEVLVGEGGFGGDGEDLLGDVSEEGVLGVVEVVIVELQGVIVNSGGQSGRKADGLTSRA